MLRSWPSGPSWLRQQAPPTPPPRHTRPPVRNLRQSMRQFRLPRQYLLHCPQPERRPCPFTRAHPSRWVWTTPLSSIPHSGNWCRPTKSTTTTALSSLGPPLLRRATSRTLPSDGPFRTSALLGPSGRGALLALVDDMRVFTVRNRNHHRWRSIGAYAKGRASRKRRG